MTLKETVLFPLFRDQHVLKMYHYLLYLLLIIFLIFECVYEVVNSLHKVRPED